MKVPIPNDAEKVLCPGLVLNQKSRRHGQRCNHILARRNSKGEVAGVLYCRHCKKSYEVADNLITLIKEL